jgi:hypothetical protein
MEIVNVNTELLRELEERIAGIGGNLSTLNLWHDEDACVGDIFLNLVMPIKLDVLSR